MYEKPRLQRFGTLRELTLAGGAKASDDWTTDSTDGCALTSSRTYTCTAP